ncbi:hypothetical protein NXS19_003123 [Fusarium pseudograminearum]|nr:hypothetical protein NXS19_003123 [Fusarium pseudograminearum]
MIEPASIVYCTAAPANLLPRFQFRNSLEPPFLPKYQPAIAGQRRFVVVVEPLTWAIPPTGTEPGSTIAIHDRSAQDPTCLLLTHKVLFYGTLCALFLMSIRSETLDRAK